MVLSLIYYIFLILAISLLLRIFIRLLCLAPTLHAAAEESNNDFDFEVRVHHRHGGPY